MDPVDLSTFLSISTNRLITLLVYVPVVDAINSRIQFSKSEIIQKTHPRLFKVIPASLQIIIVICARVFYSRLGIRVAKLGNNEYGNWGWRGRRRGRGIDAIFSFVRCINWSHHVSFFSRYSYQLLWRLIRPNCPKILYKRYPAHALKFKLKFPHFSPHNYLHRFL